MMGTYERSTERRVMLAGGDKHYLYSAGGYWTVTKEKSHMISNKRYIKSHGGGVPLRGGAGVAVVGRWELAGRR